MPAMANPEMTEDAIADLLAQSVPVKVLLILQGVAGAFRQRMESIAEGEPRLLVWVHDPPLPSLSATWNRALQAVWEAGGEEALVVNNDVRLRPDTVSMLRTVMDQLVVLFVTAVGVTQEQYEAVKKSYAIDLVDDLSQRGGPDFSCFLISKAGHQRYPFDEGFVPAFCEDLDTHRRYMLNSDGDKIFSINLPYLHLGGGSNTLKAMEPEARAKHEARIGISRAYYERKWGGPVNGERYTIPFDPGSAQDGVTTPDLQRLVQAGALVPTDDSLEARVLRGELLSDRENDELQEQRKATHVLADDTAVQS
jgi:hypothetical protein